MSDSGGMKGPWRLLKDIPSFLYEDVGPILWPVILPIMLVYVVVDFLITPVKEWNK